MSEEVNIEDFYVFPKNDKTKDKFDIAAEVFKQCSYDVDDLAKLICRTFNRMSSEIGLNESNVSKVIYGDGKKFILSIDMKVHQKGQ